MEVLTSLADHSWVVLPQVPPSRRHRQRRARSCQTNRSERRGILDRQGHWLEKLRPEYPTHRVVLQRSRRSSTSMACAVFPQIVEITEISGRVVAVTTVGGDRRRSRWSRQISTRTSAAR